MQIPYQIHLGDCLEILKIIPSNSVDSLITDPPAGISFNNLDWDDDKGGRAEWILWLTQIMIESLRVLKPGAHGFVWALPRTSHWTATALENAGFKIRDIVSHVFGSGFPKNMDMQKAITRTKHIDMDLIYKATAWIRNRRNELGLTNKNLDAITGVRGGACHWTAKSPSAQPAIPTLERWQRLEKALGPAPDWMIPLIQPSNLDGNHSELSHQWQGWGTALKPSSEHWILIQKPMSAPNTAANLLKYGTGSINIDASRIPSHTRIPDGKMVTFTGGKFLWRNFHQTRTKIYKSHSAGRHPTNFILTKSDESKFCPVKILNAESENGKNVSDYFKIFLPEKPFIYCKKPLKAEKIFDNTHPTVKPVKLMSYFIKMTTPPKGTVLDPFMGSGTTGIASIKNGFQFIGIEKYPKYFEISKSRLDEVFSSKNEDLNE